MAPNKIVIIPLLFKDSKEVILKKSKEIEKQLKIFEPILDEREDISAGFKFNEWELKGVPIRIELGPRDLEKSEVQIKVRIEDSKRTIKIKDLKKEILLLLNNMQNKLYENAEKLLKEIKNKSE
jgi:prolyl-tRNA synthetase